MRNKRGDTIVEVMIAIIILGAALGAAFAIANKSQRTTQANHERYQAQLIVNSQAEILRQKYAQHMQTNTRDSFDDIATPGITATTSGCFNSSNNWTSPCTIVDGLYTIKVTKPIDANSGKPSSVTVAPMTYTIRVEWDGLNGVRQNVELQYGL